MRSASPQNVTLVYSNYFLAGLSCFLLDFLQHFLESKVKRSQLERHISLTARAMKRTKEKRNEKWERWRECFIAMQ